MNFYKTKYKKELMGLPNTKIIRLYKSYQKNSNADIARERIKVMKVKYDREKTKARERQRVKNGYTDTTTPFESQAPFESHVPHAATHAPPLESHAPHAATHAPPLESHAPHAPTQAPQAHDPINPESHAPHAATHAPTQAPQAHDLINPESHAPQAPVEHRYAVEVKAYERRLAEQRRAYREQQEQNERDARDEIEELRIQQLAERHRHEREIKALREEKRKLSKESFNNLSKESFNGKTADPDIERFKAELTNNFQEREQQEKIDRAKNYTEKLILLTYPNIPDALQQVYNVRGRRYHAIVKKYTELKKEHEIHMVLIRENNGYKHEVEYMYKQSLRYGTPPFSDLLKFIAR